MDEETKAPTAPKRRALQNARGFRKTRRRADFELAELGGAARERHVGYYIYENHWARRKPRRRARVVCACADRPAAGGGAFLCGYIRKSAAVGVLAYLPLFEIIRQLTDRVMLCFVRRSVLPRMSSEKRPAARTLCVVTVLFDARGGRGGVREKARGVPARGGQRGDRMVSGLLTDLKESERESEPADRVILRRRAA